MALTFHEVICCRIDRGREGIEAEFISGERAVSPQNRTHFLNTNGGSPQGFFDGYAKKCKKSIRTAEAGGAFPPLKFSLNSEKDLGNFLYATLARTPRGNKWRRRDFGAKRGRATHRVRDRGIFYLEREESHRGTPTLEHA